MTPIPRLETNDTAATTPSGPRALDRAWVIAPIRDRPPSLTGSRPASAASSVADQPTCPFALVRSFRDSPRWPYSLGRHRPARELQRVRSEGRILAAVTAASPSTTRSWL